MGITCNPIGKMKGNMKKMENAFEIAKKVIKQKEKKENKKNV